LPCNIGVTCAIIDDPPRKQVSFLPRQVGYGDITPVTAAEEMVAMLIMVVGAIFFGFLIGSLGEAMQARQPDQPGFARLDGWQPEAATEGVFGAQTATAHFAAADILLWQ
jgi:Ion channel